MKSASSAESAVLGTAFIRVGEAQGLDDAELSTVLDDHRSLCATFTPRTLAASTEHRSVEPGFAFG